MSSESIVIRILVPEGVLGLDLKTNRIDFPLQNKISPAETIVRDQEVRSILEDFVARRLLTMALLQTARIWYESSNKVKNGIVIDLGGKYYDVQAELTAGNRN